MMSSTLAEKRVNDFERKYGEVALQLAYHAALPVALNADLLHLLRINFFLDPPTTLPYTAEFELLLSPLCREIDEGLYEIEPEIRDILLQGLCSIDRGHRIKDVATLLWQYVDRDAVWIDRVELERAQQLTVLNFLAPAQAKDYLAVGDVEIDDGKIAERDWYVAMRQEIDKLPELPQPDVKIFNNKIFSNLPSVSHSKFIGRAQEVDKLIELISPNSRQFIHAIQGIGGIGKTSLALEVAHRCLEARSNNIIDRNIPIFDAFIFTSSKSIDFVTNVGLVARPEKERTLIDIFRAISETLEEGKIVKSPTEHQKQEVYKALSKQSTLLIVDNMETLSEDETNKFLEFLINVPPPTQVIITTRESLLNHISCSRLLLKDLTSVETNKLIEEELISKNIPELQPEDRNKIFNYVGGNSLAIKFITGLIASGSSIENILDSTSYELTDYYKYLNEMPVNKVSIASKTNISGTNQLNQREKQPDAAKLRKIQENIAILRNSRSTDLEKISALKALGRAIDNEQAIQAILFLTRTNKNNDVIAEAVKSLGKIGKKISVFFRKC